MSECAGCGKDTDRVSTHWEGCHEHHPECAAYKAGVRDGMRRAAEIVLREASDDGCDCEYCTQWRSAAEFILREVKP